MKPFFVVTQKTTILIFTNQNIYISVIFPFLLPLPYRWQLKPTPNVGKLNT